MDSTANSTSRFLTIPGFERYRIHVDTLEVQSSANSRKDNPTWYTLKPNQNQVEIRDNKRKRVIKCHLPRLLYAALHGIDPTALASDAQVVMRDGTLVVTDINGCREYAEARKKSMQTKEIVQSKYTDTILFCQMILDAYHTNNFGPVIEEFMKYRRIVEAYIRKKKLAYSENSVKRLWEMSFDRAIECIVNHKCVITNPGKFLYVAARNQHLQDLREKKKLVHVDFIDTVKQWKIK